jgi:hypothetical protein
MCAPSPPPAPDYLGAAKQQGEANLDAAKLQGKINNPNVVNPYGTQATTYGSGLNQEAYNTAQSNYESQLMKYLNAGGANQQATIAGPSGNRGGFVGQIPNPNFIAKPSQPNQMDYILGDKDQPTLTQTFSPAQQALFDESNKAKLSLSQLATRGAGTAGEVLGKNVDLSGMPGAPTSGGVNQRVIDSMMGRVNEDYGKATDEKNSSLIAAGIRPGSTAYDNSMQLLQRGKNDASQQAVLAGYQQGGKEFEQDTASRRNAIAEYMAQRQTPLNEITALMSGSQVSNPFSVPAYAQNAQVAPAPLFGATQQAANWQSDLYNAQAAQAGNLQQGLFSLGGAGLMAGGMASDRRLKSNIVRIGTHPLGIGWYEYDISGMRQQGVMADEVATVRPEAVMTMANGYQAVDYGGLHATV